MRRLLTVLQFSGAMALTAVTLAIAWQTYFAMGANPGFDPTPLLVIELPNELHDDQDKAAARGLREALRQIPEVVDIANAGDPIGRSLSGLNYEVSRTQGGSRISSIGHPYAENYEVTRADGKHASLLGRLVSTNFFEVYGIRPLAGSLFDKKMSPESAEALGVINASAARALGFATPQAAIGQILGAGSISFQIIGVAPDIRYENLHTTPGPVFYGAGDLGPESSVLTIRANGDMRELEKTAERLARQYFPDQLVTIRRAQSYFAENYADDLRLAKLLGLASCIALAIAAFGIYVLSAYNVQRLARQIVLRKLYGANRRAIGQLVGREFIALIALSAAIGLSLAALANQRYLASFVERAPIGAWTLLAALLVALLVAFAATLRHTTIAMRMSPALALRD